MQTCSWYELSCAVTGREEHMFGPLQWHHCLTRGGGGGGCQRLCCSSVCMLASLLAAVALSDARMHCQWGWRQLPLAVWLAGHCLPLGLQELAADGILHLAVQVLLPWLLLEQHFGQVHGVHHRCRHQPQGEKLPEQAVMLTRLAQPGCAQEHCCWQGCVLGLLQHIATIPDAADCCAACSSPCKQVA